jgi:hypothetical protein
MDSESDMFQSDPPSRTRDSTDVDPQIPHTASQGTAGR